MARNFDCKELKKLKKQLEEVQKEKDVFLQECAKELAQRLLRKVVKRTPIGKAPKLNAPQTVKVKVRGRDGKIRTRSFLTKTGEIYQKYWKGYSGGSLRRSWTVGEIQKEGDIYKIEVINPMEYASYVEYGHRQKPGRYVPALGKRLKKGWVRGQFMLTISEKEIQELSPRLLEKKMQEFLKGALDAK